ncbi:bifunctional DNA polymerase alpha-delta-epsilon [Babesia duncani]|uniref:DNA polymerase II subunit 2 n=1 Tax=Babesia duncani TaxID=323732 RepID=A0AAD9PNI4_9APIC|nr:bifunctional DNA polymerase alpha-delta-epsilon [Babesia duncani]
MAISELETAENVAKAGDNAREFEDSHTLNIPPPLADPDQFGAHMDPSGRVPILVDRMSRAGGPELLYGTLNVDDSEHLCLEGYIVQVPIKFLDACKIGPGIYCRGHIVIVRGQLSPCKTYFGVSELWHPSKGSGEIDASIGILFGGKMTPLELMAYESRALKLINVAGASIPSTWIVIAHLKLDLDPSVVALERLLQRLLVNGYQQPLPAGLVFMGDFSSVDWHDLQDRQRYNIAMDNLYQIFSRPAHALLLERCHLVFIPGPRDAVPCPDLFPLPPMIGTRIPRFEHVQSRTVFASNPCRIRHGTRRLKFFKHKITQCMLSQALQRSGAASVKDLTRQLVETWGGQAHACPVATKSGHHSSLMLYPPPHLVSFQRQMKFSL